MKIIKRVFTLLFAAVLLLACVGCGSTATVTFFKAGKADAAVVQTKNAVILVDAGLAKNSADLIEDLQALGVEAIDVFIVSHFDKDHVGGAADVIDVFPIGTVYQSNCPKESDEHKSYLAALAAAGIEPVTVTDTVSFHLDGLHVTIDGPASETYAVDPSNNSSLIASVTKGSTTVLFTGDAENARLSEYQTEFRRPSGKLILKVPYHGHWQSSLPAFLTAAAPDIAVIPCSKDEPSATELSFVTELLEGLGAETYLTYNGDVSFPLS